MIFYSLTHNHSVGSCRYLPPCGPLAPPRMSRFSPNPARSLSRVHSTWIWMTIFLKFLTVGRATDPALCALNAGVTTGQLESYTFCRESEERPSKQEGAGLCRLRKQGFHGAKPPFGSRPANRPLLSAGDIRKRPPVKVFKKMRT